MTRWRKESRGKRRTKCGKRQTTKGYLEKRVKEEEEGRNERDGRGYQIEKKKCGGGIGDKTREEEDEEVETRKRRRGGGKSKGGGDERRRGKKF